MSTPELGFNWDAMGVSWQDGDGNELYWLDSVHEEAISEDIDYLTQSLAAIHGDLRLARERNGLHAYLASPECLVIDGAGELSKKHLAINLDKAMAGEANCALCMKTRQRYSVAALLRMRPLNDRLADYSKLNRNKAKVYWGAQARDEDMETDERGNRIPKHPGYSIPLSQLPPTHPAMVFLAHRRMTPQMLEKPFQAVYCETPSPGVWYKDMPGGISLSPAGCIVAFCYQNGVRRAWQARILDFKQDGWHWYYHPQQGRWVCLGQVDPATGKTQFTAEFQRFIRIPYRMCRRR